jgi:hypothetical protein
LEVALMDRYKIEDRVRVIGIGYGEVSKVRHDDRGDAIYTVRLYEGTDFYARDVELRPEVPGEVGQYGR